MPKAQASARPVPPPNIEIRTGCLLVVLAGAVCVVLMASAGVAHAIGQAAQ
jgi:hypothetical protein